MEGCELQESLGTQNIDLPVDALRRAWLEEVARLWKSHQQADDLEYN